MHHRVDDLLVAEPVAGAGAGEQVGRLRHGLHPAGDDDFSLARPDREVGEVDRVEAGQADLVDRGGRHRHRDAGLYRGLAGCDLTLAGLQHLAHEDIVDVLRRYPCPLEGGPDGHPAQVHGGEPGEGAGEPADRSAGAGDDDRTGHFCTSTIE